MSIWTLCRLRIAILVSRQRYVPIAVGLVAMPLVTVPAGGSPSDAYALMVFLVPLLSAPLGVVVSGAGSHAVRAVTTASAGGPHRVILAEALLMCMASSSIGIALAAAVPVLAGVPAATSLTVEGCCCLVGATLGGAAAGLLTSAHVLRQSGVRMLACMGLLFVLLLIPELSPVAESQHALTGSSPSPLQALLPVATGGLGLALAVGLSIGVARRRGLV
jgi:hypothetical protein